MSRISATVITVVALVAITLGVVLATASPAAAQTCGPLNNGRVANVVYKGNAVFFDPIVRYEYDRAILTISGPCENIVRTFKPGEQIFFDLAEVKRTLDGSYTWQLRFTPVIDPAVQEALQSARGTGEEDDLWWSFWQKGAIPAGPSVDSASFSVVAGAIVDPASGEESQKSATLSRRSTGGASLGSAALAAAPAAAARGDVDLQGGGGISGGASLAPKDFVIIDDLIVDGSACIGFDCVNGESFGFDTIRLKENNLRIKFDDTSTAASFPRNDWQLTANDSANGGASKFSIDDISGSRTPFTIEAGAPSHSLYVDDGGRVGFGTSTPSVELHAIDGDTPTLRLQQDGSSGFAPQTWDVAGNETNFFVRDVTNGSTLPLRIRPGASSNAVFIDSDDDVGMGTSSPDAALDIERGGGGSAVAFLRFTNTNGPSRLEFRDNTGNVDWDFRTTSGDTFVITQPTSPSNDFMINSAGNVTVRGTLTTSGPTCGSGCDRVLEPDFALESIEAHAARMRELSYLPEVGPTQPGAPFNVSEKTGGILNELEKAHLYIIQLNERLSEKEARLNEYEETNGTLRARQERLEAELASLKRLVESIDKPE